MLELSQARRLCFRLKARCSSHGAYGDSDVPALKRCGERTQLDAAMLYDAIDGWYKKDSSNWDKPPFIAFYQAIVRGLCANDINEERRKKGMPTLR